MKNAAYCVFETPLGTCGIAWRVAADSDSQAVVTAVQLPEATPQATESRIARKSGASQPGVPPREIEEVIGKIRKHLQGEVQDFRDRKSTRLNSSHLGISYAVFCLKK